MKHKISPEFMGVKIDKKETKKYQEKFGGEKKMRKPDQRFDASPCSVSMWLNQAKIKGAKPYWKVALQRSFMDQGQWKHDSNFKLDEVPKVLLLLDKAFEHATEMEIEAV